ncbi:MAG: CaiB/BaiF CoA-transferase family protein, partial [Pseudomonadota bacterium]|nr:CaiB/BaiF CoA-transferase family protein [Pseudomonadota bacterium]
LCTRQLAELGARVIKIERRQKGDFARHYDDRVKGLCSHFVWTNRSKESLTLDLKHPAAAGILARLLTRADVLVQNLAPSAAARMGLGYEALATDYPQLIVCNVTGYGEEGPYASKKAYDLLVQAEAGFLSVTGSAEDPAKSGISIADIAAGTQAHTAILAALLQRQRTGSGCRIDISMLEAMVEWMGFPLYYAYDRQQAPVRSGADHASIYPYGVFRSGDDKLLMLGIQNEREWVAFCELVLCNAALAEDSRFVSNTLRSENRKELQELVQQSFSTKTAAEIRASLDAAAIANASANDMAAVWDHPQLRALRRFVEVETPVGTVTALQPPGHSSAYDPRLTAVPALGEHTEAIMEDLGYSEAEIAEFRTALAI